MWGQRVAENLRLTLSWPDDEWLLTLPWEGTKRAIFTAYGSDLGDLADKLPKFVKSSNWKSITSRTYFTKADLPDFAPEEKFLLSDPVVFESEYRAFLLDGVPLTITRYATFGQLDIHHEEGVADAKNFLHDIQDELANLPRGVCVDVGVIKDRGWAVVEANPAWCSGMYGHDPNRVLDVLLATTLTKP